MPPQANPKSPPKSAESATPVKPVTPKEADQADEDEGMSNVMEQLDSVLQDDNEPTFVRAEASNATMQFALETAASVEAAVLADWAQSEADRPTQPHRALGINPSVGTNKDVIKARFLSRMSACLKEAKQPRGSSRILLLRAKRAYEILTNPMKWEEFQEDRKARIEDQTCAKLRYANGFYEGDVLNPRSQLDGAEPVRHGKGVNVLSDGELYEGNFKNNRREGIGLCFWRNGDLYLGQWRKDVPKGKGCYYYASGMSYVGPFADGVQNGTGLQIWPDGTVYGGHFEAGRRSGTGVLELPKSSSGVPIGRYEGQWKDNAMHGKGYYEICDRDGVTRTYDGEFQENLFHGRGKLTLPGGASYTGNFFRGKCHGEGHTYKFASGETYQGDFRHGKRHGFGDVTGNGVEFTGDWKDDKPHGKGKLAISGGVGPLGAEDATTMSMSGDWVEGQLDGPGSMAWPSGSTYKGRFRDGTIHGLGVVRFSDGSSWDGKFIKNNAEAALQKPGGAGQAPQPPSQPKEGNES